MDIRIARGERRFAIVYIRLLCHGYRKDGMSRKQESWRVTDSEGGSGKGWRGSGLKGSVGSPRYRRGGARSEVGDRDELKLVAGASVRRLALATISWAEVAAA